MTEVIQQLINNFENTGSNNAIQDAFELPMHLRTGATFVDSLREFEKGMVPRASLSVLASRNAAIQYGHAHATNVTTRSRTHVDEGMRQA